ncbi:TIGR01777 family oxidoreductase [Ornithinimicrobium sufpigmenti]|uniref:TIGR01777 family oxidoreductase n=1 Tax=Ornithinimicrobium sufpigmenti TaxID=2508882 RepID=UPI001036CD72|nr:MULTISPECIES: TIGR01777 family oxidoreductase [unclassified Ornithinimicrobium]
MAIAITGASGLIGSALSSALRGRGDQVLHLVRRAPRVADELDPGVREARWTPGADLDPEVLDGVTGVVHLAGAGVADRRWTDRRKRELLESRTEGTGTIARALAVRAAARDTSASAPPRLVSASGVGIYGDRGDEVLTEESAPGAGFLADVCRDWEAATWPAGHAGVPVATVRTGIVLAPQGGALGKLLPLAKAGLAGPLGGGDQYWAWITLHDHVRALMFLLDHPEVTGPVNLTGPHPDTQTAIVKALAHALRRPAVVPAPTIALRLALGEMASEILASGRALPTVLTEAGFTFDHPDLTSAMAWITES